MFYVFTTPRQLPCVNFMFQMGTNFRYRYRIVFVIVVILIQFDAGGAAWLRTSEFLTDQT